MELARAQGAHIEERDSLVREALHALHQLRSHLGAVHAIRPEVAKPVDQALVVKNVRTGVTRDATRPELMPTHPAYTEEVRRGSVWSGSCHELRIPLLLCCWGAMAHHHTLRPTTTRQPRPYTSRWWWYVPSAYQASSIRSRSTGSSREQ